MKKKLRQSTLNSEKKLKEQAVSVLWAPWRMEYLKPVQKTPGVKCVFCHILKTKRDRENLIVARGMTSYLVLNKYPYNNGHCMVVLNRHCAHFHDLKSNELLEVMELLQKGTQVLRSLYRPDGFNLGMNIGRAGGAGIVDHLHFHIVPRWYGDTNFLPLLATTKSMPQHLMDSYDHIKEEFHKRGARS